MSVLPSSKAERVQWCQDHVEPWTTNFAAIGVTSAAVSAWSTKVTAASSAFDAKRLAYQAAEAATNDYYAAVAAMTNASSALIKQIKAQAQIVGPTVYGLAEIPAPADPTHRDPPGTPTDLKLELTPTGILLMKWKCNNPRGLGGTMYQVYRRHTPLGAFLPLGGTGSKSFTDDSIPAGSTQLTYQIQAVRSTALGIAAEFNVNFGINSGGGTTAILVQPTAKLAA